MQTPNRLEKEDRKLIESMLKQGVPQVSVDSKYEVGDIQVVGSQESAIASLTDSSGGTANDTLEAISASYSQSEVANNFADLGAKINAIITVLENHGLIST